LRNVLTGRVAYYPTWKTTFNLFTKEDKQKAYEALQRVDLADKVYTRADQLSGGQQQRVAIARVLTQNPKIILADEPTSALDSDRVEMVGKLLKDLATERNKAVIVVTHDLRLRQFADKIYQLEDGKLKREKVYQ